MPGQWVERGAILGLCGNSGYSPQPHIHVQVQAVETIGATTVPFSFTSYRQGSTFFANDLPKTSEVIEPVYADKGVDLRTTFILDQQFNYKIYRNGVYEKDWSIIVRMAADSTFYFDSGNGQLYFGKKEGTFYFYNIEGEDECLRQLFLALPRLPLTALTGTTWRDYVPIGVLTTGWRKAVYLFLSSFHHGLAQVDTVHSLQAGGKITGQIHSGVLKMDHQT